MTAATEAAATAAAARARQVAATTTAATEAAATAAAARAREVAATATISRSRPRQTMNTHATVYPLPRCPGQQASRRHEKSINAPWTLADAIGTMQAFMGWVAARDT